MTNYRQVHSKAILWYTWRINVKYMAK